MFFFFFFLKSKQYVNFFWFSYDRVGLPGSVTASFFGKAATTLGLFVLFVFSTENVNLFLLGATRPASSGSHEDIIEARRERFGPKWIRVLRVSKWMEKPKKKNRLIF